MAHEAIPLLTCVKMQNLTDVLHFLAAEGAAAAGAGRLTKTEAFLAGGAARAVAAAATCPVTVVKTRMEYTGSGVNYTVRAFHMPWLCIDLHVT